MPENFKTPADLGISDVEFESLVKVLGMLEREEIEPNQFDMSTVMDKCGTPACLCGWANFISGRRAFPFVTAAWGGMPDWQSMPGSLKRLFAYGAESGHRVYEATPAQAAIALRNYLTFGEARWEETLAE